MGKSHGVPDHPDAFVSLAQATSLDLGLQATKFLTQRLNAEVVGYQAEGNRTSIRLHIPSRAKRFRAVVERSQQLIEESAQIHSASSAAAARAQALAIAKPHN